MCTTLLCLVVLFVAPIIDAAPAPAPASKAKEKLEALRKRLPALVSDWLKKEGKQYLISDQWACKPELRVLRQIGPDRAKAVILFEVSNDEGERALHRDILLTVFLTYHDACWTTERFETARRGDSAASSNPTFSYLMLAIDEAGEKP
jgi:hypothetical protein